jgi:hypothetical protein
MQASCPSSSLPSNSRARQAKKKNNSHCPALRLRGGASGKQQCHGGYPGRDIGLKGNLKLESGKAPTWSCPCPAFTSMADRHGRPSESDPAHRKARATGTVAPGSASTTSCDGPGHSLAAIQRGRGQWFRVRVRVGRATARRPPGQALGPLRRRWRLPQGGVDSRDPLPASVSAVDRLGRGRHLTREEPPVGRPPAGAHCSGRAPGWPLRVRR